MTEKKSSQVAIEKGDRGKKPVLKALDLIDYETALASYSRILIKVNFIKIEKPKPFSAESNGSKKNHGLNSLRVT